MGREAGRPPGEQGVRLQVGAPAPTPRPTKAPFPGVMAKCVCPQRPIPVGTARQTVTRAEGLQGGGPCSGP